MLKYDIKNWYNGNKIVINKDISKFKEAIELINFNNMNILYYNEKDFGVKTNKE